jgi:hypothetical protein
MEFIASIVQVLNLSVKTLGSRALDIGFRIEG